MLGFSIQKLLVLVAIIGAVWWGFKWISRLDRMRKAEHKSKAGKVGGGTPRVEEMVECPGCKTYQVPKPDNSCSNCGRLL